MSLFSFFHVTDHPAPFPERLYSDIQDDIIYNKGRHRVMSSGTRVFNRSAPNNRKQMPRLKNADLLPMWNNTRNILQKFYAPHNNILKEVIGPQFRVWEYG